MEFRMTDKELADLGISYLKQTSISYLAWRRNVDQGKYPDQTTTMWWKALDTFGKIGVAIVPPDPPPTPIPTNPSVYDMPILRNPKTITVAASSSEVRFPDSSDYIVDLQKIVRGKRLLIWGKAGQRILVKNGRWNVTTPYSQESSYWRGGPGVRSDDGIGPEVVYWDGGIVQGSTHCDGLTVAAGPATRVVLHNYLIESVRQTTGQASAEPTDHADTIQVQGPIGILAVDNCTLNAQDISGGVDPGKGIMLQGVPLNTGVKHSTYIRRTNFNMVGNVGAVVFQGDPGLSIFFDDGVFLDAALATWQKWTPGSGLFYPYSWVSSGTAPHRTLSFPALNWHGTISEGKPTTGDYVTRAMVL